MNRLPLDFFNLDRISIHQSQHELKKVGKMQRQKVKPELLGTYTPVRRDAIEMIKLTEGNMIPELLPLRHQRMGVNAFTFFRGTAELMEADLRQQNQSGILAIICGDAHVNNYGFYASPERKLLFDLNDFDEARIGNWESDLKRLMVSIILAGRVNGFDDDDLRKILKKVVKVYRRSVKYDYHQSLASNFYSSFEINDMMQELKDSADGHVSNSSFNKILNKILVKSSKSNSETITNKMTKLDKNGKRVFVDNPPRARHVTPHIYQEIVNGYYSYRSQVRSDVRVFLANFNISDIIRYSVGVGSFGTRCYLMLLTGVDGSHLVLQIKESMPLRYNLLSLPIVEAVKRSRNAGERIVTAQKVLQSASDPFLGSTRFGNRSYYIRQFRDMKESINTAKLDLDGFALYTETCALLLAKAHFQSPTAPIIYGYVKGQKQLDSALTDWCFEYAKQVNIDFQRFKDALNPKTQQLEIN
ncbi:DUF2252 domain-containing protein [Limosilactobacillus sp.]|uniref:DUF2252 domain-containing protein n=1 Tax=Limosilactobacillus sp. TaxID=2773925 RepID=UPI00345E10BE